MTNVAGNTSRVSLQCRSESKLNASLAVARLKNAELSIKMCCQNIDRTRHRLWNHIYTICVSLHNCGVSMFSYPKQNNFV
jgi:hypothetical protein